MVGLGWVTSRVVLDSICAREHHSRVEDVIYRQPKRWYRARLTSYVSEEIDQSGGNLHRPPDSSGRAPSGMSFKYCKIFLDIANPAVSRGI